MRCLLPALVWVRAGTKGSSPADPGATKDKQDPHQSFFEASHCQPTEAEMIVPSPQPVLGRQEVTGAGQDTPLSSFPPCPMEQVSEKLAKTLQEGRAGTAQ